MRLVVPTPGGAEIGLHYAIPGARCGVVLVSGDGELAPLVDRVYTELGYYLQAAGVPCIQLRRPRASSLARQLCHLVGAVSALRALGIERVVVAVVPERTWSDEVATGQGLEVLIGALRQQAGSAEGFARSVADLTGMFRDTADTVVGLATLLDRDESRPVDAAARGDTSATRRFPIPFNRGAVGPATGDATISRLVVDLADARRCRATDVVTSTSLVSRLYLWSTSVLTQPHHTRHVGRATMAARAAASRQQEALAVQEVYHQRLDWLEDQWQTLVAMLELRAPEQAKQIVVLAERDDGARHRAMRAARSAWRYMDMEARRDWLRICSTMFSTESTG